jgi:hypothetical protein
LRRGVADGVLMAGTIILFSLFAGIGYLIWKNWDVVRDFWEMLKGPIP